MLCPTCQQPLQTQTLDNQRLWHCINCGSTFFDENSINRISAKTAETLAANKKIPINPPAQLICPRDNIFLLPLDEESIPKHVKLFQCPQCKGLLASPEDLIAFKKAQEAKVNYFKLWQIPLPTLQSVIVISFVGIIFVGFLLSNTLLQGNSLKNTQATDVVHNIAITTTGQYFFITFKTEIPLKSQIIFTDQSSGIKQTKDVSKTFTTLHQLVTGDINRSDSYIYQIVLIDKSANVVLTTPQPLEAR